jgi:hypothetical protein
VEPAADMDAHDCIMVRIRVESWSRDARTDHSQVTLSRIALLLRYLLANARAS